ncbi:MAG: hypothetical protein JKY08_05850 [Flavobacteriaceae bacterium]|nr:hypothetical protein [Flavobacteriaceae bacterium]
MKNLKLKSTLVALILTFNLIAQTAPKGKKTLDVKENYAGEYTQEVTTGGLATVVVNALKKRVPKKLKKYGFEDITILKVGKVKVPTSLATKMSKAVGGNKAVGEAQLVLANTSSEIKRAVDKIYETETETDIDWKFQVNFIDNQTGKEFRIRLSSMSYAPKYIIRESTTEVNLRK